MRKLLLLVVLLIVSLTFLIFPNKHANNSTNLGEDYITTNDQSPHPLTIEALKKEILGSDITLEQTLEQGQSYNRYVASYKSDGLKIYGLLTVPTGERPKDGWPVVIFNHGYIPSKEYQTTQRYVAYVDGFARSGYIVFKSDYRGHGLSEGEAVGAYGSNAYSIDVLNAVASLKKYKEANPNKIGMWGHSLGGFLTLRSMVVDKDIKAGVIWAGVVGSYPDLINNLRRGRFSPPPGIPQSARRFRDVLIDQFGTPEQNPKFWQSLSANSYLADISGPLQLHHGISDESVPVNFSEKLYTELKDLDKEVELFKYDGDDHNISSNFEIAMQRSIDFFDRFLK